MRDYQAFSTIQAMTGALLCPNYWITAPSNFLKREKELSGGKWDRSKWTILTFPPNLSNNTAHKRWGREKSALFITIEQLAEEGQPSV